MGSAAATGNRYQRRGCDMNTRSMQRSGRTRRFGASVALSLSAILLPAPPIVSSAWGQQFLADELRRQAERVIGDVIRSVPSPQTPGGQSSGFQGGGPDRIEYDRLHDYTPDIDAATLQGSTGEMRSSAYGRVLIIHPFPGGRPAVMERTTYLAGDHASLEFSVRGHPFGDMLVRVWATPEHGRSERIYEQTIVGRNGWYSESVDLARYRGQAVTVRFEVHATGWHFEYAALDAFFIEGGGARPVAAAAPLPPNLSRAPLTLDGIGPIRIGMTVNDASAAAQVRLVSESDPGLACSLYKPEGGPKGVLFGVMNGRIQMIVADGWSRSPTLEGVRVGDAPAKVRHTYRSQVKAITSESPDACDAYVVIANNAAGTPMAMIFGSCDAKRIDTIVIGTPAVTKVAQRGYFRNVCE